MTILWVPAHINFYGHDIADMLAKEGTESPQIYNIKYSVQELKDITRIKYTNIALQTYWNESRTGTFGKRVIPNYLTTINIDNFTKINSDHHLLLRLTFGTAEFHISRNRACVNCQQNLSIEHAIMHCRLFDQIRDQVKFDLNRTGKEFNLENFLDPKCDKTVKENRNLFIREIHGQFTI